MTKRDQSEAQHATPAPASERTALLVIDMLNDYEHADGDLLRVNAERAVPVIAELRDRALQSDTLVVYVNDNQGDWTSERAALIERVEAIDDAPTLIAPIVPPECCPLLFKVRHSAFYGTSLAYLLQRHDIGRLVLTGQVTEQCVLYTALDAYIRHFEVLVATDAVAMIDEELSNAALEMMRRNMGATLLAASDVTFS